MNVTSSTLELGSFRPVKWNGWKWHLQFFSISFCNCFACRHSVNAHISVTSGPNIVANIAPNRKTAKRKGLAPFGGTFRWTDTHAANISVDAHDHNISVRLRVLGQSQRPVSGFGWSQGARRISGLTDGPDAGNAVGVEDPDGKARNIRSANTSIGW